MGKSRENRKEKSYCLVLLAIGFEHQNRGVSNYNKIEEGSDTMGKKKKHTIERRWKLKEKWKEKKRYFS